MKLLPEYLKESLESGGENLAIHCNNQEYTYDDLKGMVSFYQAEFKRKGVNKDQFVGIVTGQDIHVYAAIIAMVTLGIPYIPINRSNPADRFFEIIGEANLTHVLYSSLPSQLKKFCEQTNDFELVSIGNIKPSATQNIDISKIDPEDYAYMLFTSGSTGKPKGVLIKHINLAAFISLYFNKDHYILSEKDRFLQMFDWTFDLAGMMTFIPLSLGASCFVVPESGIKYYNILSVLLEKEITVSMLVPSTLLYIKPYIEELSLPRIRYSMFCGEPLLHEITVDWSKCLPETSEIQNVYGPSECPGASSIYKWTEEESSQQSVNGIVPIGKPVPGMEFFVIDDDRNILSPNEMGSIALASEQVSDNYWNDPERTSEAYFTLSNGKKVYDTGDIGYKNEHGNYIFVGRKDHQLKLDGYRVEPGEVEHIVRGFLGADTRVAFVATQNDKGLLVPHLFIEDLKLGESELYRYLESKLPPYMIPHQIHNLDNFPHNMNGKTDRKSLQKILVN